MNLADEAKARLGGVRSAARALGVPLSTFAGWLENGVPHWRKEAVRKKLAAHAELEDLTPPYPKG